MSVWKEGSRARRQNGWNAGDSVFITVGGLRIQTPSVDFTEQRDSATRTGTLCY